DQQNGDRGGGGHRDVLVLEARRREAVGRDRGERLARAPEAVDLSKKRRDDHVPRDQHADHDARADERGQADGEDHVDARERQRVGGIAADDAGGRARQDAGKAIPPPSASAKPISIMGRNTISTPGTRTLKSVARFRPVTTRSRKTPLATSWLPAVAPIMIDATVPSRISTLT